MVAQRRFRHNARDFRHWVGRGADAQAAASATEDSACATNKPGRTLNA